MSFLRISLVLCLLLPSVAKAQEFSLYGNGRYALFDGEITSDSHKRFSLFLSDHPEVVGLRLNSPGGTVVASLAIADEIAKRRLSTFIAKGDSCASACAVVFFAGHDRLVQGRLGVHQMSDGGRGDVSVVQFVLAAQLDAFARFDVPWTVGRRMLETPPTQMYWFNQSEIEQLALNRDQPDDAGRTASQSAPGYQFADYPAEGNLTGKPQAPDFAGRAQAFGRYRTRIQEGVQAGVNFAGHYRVIEIGCGTSCRFAYVVDLASGEVDPFPYGGEDQYQMKLLYAPESRLLKARWTASDDEGCVEQDLVMDSFKWTVLEERSAPKVEGFCDYSCMVSRTL